MSAEFSFPTFRYGMALSFVFRQARNAPLTLVCLPKLGPSYGCVKLYVKSREVCFSESGPRRLNGPRSTNGKHAKVLRSSLAHDGPPSRWQARGAIIFG